MSAMTTEADYWITQQMGQWRTARKVGSCANCRHKWQPGERYLDTGEIDYFAKSPFATVRICRACAEREVS